MRIFMQALKDWQEFRRDHLSIALSFLLPLITLLLFAYGIRLQAHDLKVAVQDCSMSQSGRNLFEKLQATKSLHPIAEDGRRSDYDFRDIERGKAKALVLIPSDLQRNLLNSKPTDLKVVVDGTDIINGRFVEGTIYGAALGAFSSDLGVHHSDHFLYNPGLKESLFVVPGVYGIVFWIFPCLLACVAVAREKEQGSMVQLAISSMKSYEYVLGKGLLYWVLAMGQATLVILCGFFLFGIKFQASPLPFLFSLPLYLAASVLFGLAIGIWSRSQTSAVQAVSSLAFFTSLLLSGFIYPIENIPDAFAWISYLVPPRYFIEISRDAFIRGVGWNACMPDMLILLTFFLLLLCLAISGSRRIQARSCS
jgi:ABC-2 type transport system permease protein